MKEKLSSYDLLYTDTVNNAPLGLDSNIRTQYNNIVSKYQSHYKEYYKNSFNEYVKVINTINDTNKGTDIIAQYYAEAIEFNSFLQSAMLPSAVTSDVTSNGEKERLESAINNGKFNAVGLPSNSVSQLILENAVKNYAKLYVRSGYMKMEIKTTAFDVNNLTWKGYIIITNYSDESDTSTTKEFSTTFTNDYATYLTQKAQKDIADAYKKDNTYFDVFSIEEDSKFATALTLYNSDALINIYNAYESAMTVLSTSDNSGLNAIKNKYQNRLDLISKEVAIRENECNIVSHTYSLLSNRLNQIHDILSIQNYLGKDLYEEFTLYIREDEYSNTNFVSDSLTNPMVSSQAKLFLETANKELIKASTPQHTINTSIKYLALIPEFKPYITDFALNNWIRVECDGIVYRLRLIGFSIDFGTLSDISVEFSDVTIAPGFISDMQSLLQQASSMAGTYDYTVKQAEKGYQSNTTITDWIKEGLNSAEVVLKNNDNEEITTTRSGILGRAYDDITEDYDRCQFRLTHNMFAFTNNHWKPGSVISALGEHNYTYWNGTKFATATDYGLTTQFVQSGHIMGSQMIGGHIYSENYDNTKKNGSHIDLITGSFSFAGEKIKYDSTTNNMTMRGVTIEWDSTTPPEITDINGLDTQLENIYRDIEQLDGRIQSFSQTTDPSTDWNTTELKANHKGDLWFNPTNGLTKRWTGASWETITDSTLESLAKSKAQIFTEIPTVAYFKGDMLIPVESFTVSGVTYKQEKAYRALKDSNGNTFTNSDWDALDYTNDDYIINFINGDYAKTIETIKSQVDGKARAWYMSTDPSNASTNPDWDTSEDHEGDLWYNTSDSSNVTSIYKNGEWQPTNVPKAVFDTIDGKRQIFVRKPSSTSKYMTGDLWVISESDCTNGKIIVNGITYNANSTLIAVLPNGVTERTSFTESDWTDISTQDGIVALDQSTQALNKFSDIANDSKITPTEKQSIKLLYDNITAEKNSIINDCIEYEMNKSTSFYYMDYNNFNKSFTSLKTLFDSILSNMETTIDVPYNYQSTINDYYTKYDIINTDIQKASKKYSESVANAVDTKIENFQQNVNKLLNADLPLNKIGDDYIFSPYIGGGYLYIKNPNDRRSVTIDPQQTYSSNGYILKVTDKNGNVTIGADNNGNADYIGKITSTSGNIGGWDISSSSIIKTNSSGNFMQLDSSGLSLITYNKENDQKTIFGDGRIRFNIGNTQYLSCYVADWKNTTLKGMNFYSNFDSKYISFGYNSDPEIGVYSPTLILNYGINPNEHTEKVIIYGNTYISGHLVVSGDLNATGLRTYSASGTSHGDSEWVLRCKHNTDNDGYFRIYCGDGSIGTKVDYANSAGSANVANSLNSANSYSMQSLELSFSTPFIDFHYNNSTADYTTRLIEDIEGRLSCYGNFKTTGQIRSKGSYDTTTSAAPNCHIANDTYDNSIYRSTSSSRRYKFDICNADMSEIRKLYNLPIRKYKYKLDYLSNFDERYNKDIYGFIAEELDELMPIAVNHNQDGSAEMWNSNIIIPCLLGLIQDLNLRLDKIEKGVNE